MGIKQTDSLLDCMYLSWGLIVLSLVDFKQPLAELDEGRSQEAMDNFFAQSHYTDSPQTKLFYSAHYVRFIY